MTILVRVHAVHGHSVLVGLDQDDNLVGLAFAEHERTVLFLGSPAAQVAVAHHTALTDARVEVKGCLTVAADQVDSKSLKNLEQSSILVNI